MQRFNLYGFITIYGILFLIILFKVFHVPVTTDEVPTYFFYSKFSYWEIMMYPDNIPNNHILNTMLAKTSMKVFGHDQWVIRLPSLLSFFIFSTAVFSILSRTINRSSWFFLPAALIFVNPYLLDFFGLCRGYAISITMVTASIALLLEAFHSLKDKFIWLSLFAALLASYANFSALVFWASATGLVWFYFCIKNEFKLKPLTRPTIILFFISLAYLALIITPIQKMHSSNEFQYWTSNGFYDETVKSMETNWFYDSPLLTKIDQDHLFIFIFAVLLINLVLLIRQFRKEKFSTKLFTNPQFLSIILLSLPVIINLAQTEIIGTPNLNGRTALFFYPIISTLFVTALAKIQNIKASRSKKLLAIFMGLAFMLNLSHRTKLGRVKEWYYDQNTLEVINYLKEKYNGRPLSLKTSWFFHPSFYFYFDSGKAPWIDLQGYDYNLDVHSQAEYYYIFAEDYNILEPGFDVVYKFSPDRWLLKHK